MHRTAAPLLLLALGLLACSSSSPPPSGAAPSLDEKNTIASASPPAPACKLGGEVGAVEACLACCVTGHPDAQKAVAPLGQCNAACGKDGKRACFKSCESDYKAACKSTKKACRGYDECTAGCFLGFVPT